jgi:agmatinase
VLRYQRFVSDTIFGVGVAREQAKVVLVPVPWEATTSYGRGTAQGPLAIRAASVQVDLFDLELAAHGVPEPYRAGIAMLPLDSEVEARAREAADRALEVIDAYDEERPGDYDPPVAAALARVNELSGWLDDWLDRTASELLGQGKIVGVVGGDHSVPFGAIAAHARRHTGLGILHFDAHADLRVAYQGFVGSHASIMHRVASEIGVSKIVSAGVRDFCHDEYRAIVDSRGRIEAFFDLTIAQELSSGVAFAEIAARIASRLPHEVYVSFDIDGLDPTLCPHTGTPVPGGLSFRQACAIVGAVVASGRRVVGFDLVEVAPGPNGDEWDANVGARLLHKLIGFSLANR